MKLKESRIDVSVLILVYNQPLSKILLTIDSIVKQNDIITQIIVCDDGSKKSYKDELEAYFCDINYTNFVIICAEKNQGTVKNYLDGVVSATGDYIKALGPGDLLIGEYCLRDWISSLERSERRWSFSDVVCYTGEYPNRKAECCDALPRSISPYISSNVQRARWNYVVLSDFATGVSILGERNLILEYLTEINGHVLYAEDNIYRLMMFDGIVGHYYSQSTVLYELGLGISTSGNDVWNEKLVSDSLATEALMQERTKVCDRFQKSMLYSNKKMREKSLKHRKLPILKGELYYYWDKLKHKRKTLVIDIENNPFFKIEKRLTGVLNFESTKTNEQ